MSDNRAYSQFGDTASNFGNAGFAVTTSSSTLATQHEEKLTKKWKNSKRLCWGMLIVGSAALILAMTIVIVAGVEEIDPLITRGAVSVWLASLGVISSGMGLRAFRNSYESSKCWSVSHVVMSALSTLSYAALFLISISIIILCKETIIALYEAELDYDYYVERMEGIVNATTTAAETTQLAEATTSATTAAASTSSFVDDEKMLRALKAEMALGAILLGVALAFFVLSIIANVLVCRQWWQKRQKTMTIVYMPEDQSGNAQPRQIVVPAKTQVVVIPTTATQTNAFK